MSEKRSDLKNLTKFVKERNIIRFQLDGDLFFNGKNSEL